jgi:hypothetical protein
MNNLDQTLVFIALAGFILGCSCLFYAVLSHLQVYSLIPEKHKGQIEVRGVERQE